MAFKRIQTGQMLWAAPCPVSLCMWNNTLAILNEKAEERSHTDGWESDCSLLSKEDRALFPPANSHRSHFTGARNSPLNCFTLVLTAWMKICQRRHINTMFVSLLRSSCSLRAKRHVQLRIGLYWAFFHFMTIQQRTRGNGFCRSPWSSESSKEKYRQKAFLFSITMHTARWSPRVSVLVFPV